MCDFRNDEHEVPPIPRHADTPIPSLFPVSPFRSEGTVPFPDTPPALPSPDPVEGSLSKGYADTWFFSPSPLPHFMEKADGFEAAFAKMRR